MILWKPSTPNGRAQGCLILEKMAFEISGCLERLTGVLKAVCFWKKWALHFLEARNVQRIHRSSANTLLVGCLFTRESTFKYVTNSHTYPPPGRTKNQFPGPGAEPGPLVQD